MKKNILISYFEKKICKTSFKLLCNSLNIVIKKKSKNKPTKKIKEHSSCRHLIKAFTIFISKGCSIFIPNNIVPQISIILKLLMQNLNTNPIAFFIISLLKRRKALSCYITKLSNLGPQYSYLFFILKPLPRVS